MDLKIKNKKSIKNMIHYGISIFSVAAVALGILLLSSVLIAKTGISESISPFVAVIAYSVSAIFGSVLFCLLSKMRGVICGGAIGLGTCFIKLAINKFTVTSFQLATYGCIMVVCVIVGIMTANILAGREYKY